MQAPPGSSHVDVIHQEFAQILLSEELGYDSVWLTEHHFIEYGISTSPLALAGLAKNNRYQSAHPLLTEKTLDDGRATSGQYQSAG